MFQQIRARPHPVWRSDRPGRSNARAGFV